MFWNSPRPGSSTPASLWPRIAHSKIQTCLLSYLQTLTPAQSHFRVPGSLRPQKGGITDALLGISPHRDYLHNVCFVVCLAVFFRRFQLCGLFVQRDIIICDFLIMDYVLDWWFLPRPVKGSRIIKPRAVIHLDGHGMSWRDRWLCWPVGWVIAAWWCHSLIGRLITGLIDCHML